MGAKPGNVLALKHGATSERQIRPRATREKRALLRRNGLRLRDIDALGRALLQNWSRAAAALALMDEHAAEHGWVDEDGNVPAFGKLYVSMLNSERLALRALQEHLELRPPRDELAEYLRRTYAS